QHRSALEGRAALAAQLAEDPVPATSSRPVNQPPLDEIGPAYIEHRESLEGRAALQALLSEGAPAAAATATPASPGAGDRDSDVISSEELKSLREQGGDTSLFDFKSKGGSLPDFGEPTTVTGKVFESASQFIASMASLARVCVPAASHHEAAVLVSRAISSAL